MARADSEKGQITVFRLDPNGPKPFWTLDAYAPAMSVSDDCLNLVTSAVGDDFLFLGKSLPSSEAFTLYRLGKRVRSIVLSDIYSDLELITQKHQGQFWANRLAWTEGRISVHTVDGRRVLFDPVTGGKVE
ncbi:hypothetical protein AB4Y85_01900 [Microvirga sp. 2YAF29]|uniref:hypothetical protein n=1 Tax=Microvirga sp. 2YAF29 TaxID=3233031 RepID=UPI003F9D0819